MNQFLPPLTVSIVTYCYELAEDYEFGPREKCAASRHENQEAISLADYWVIFSWMPHKGPMEIVHCQLTCEECAMAMKNTE